MSASNAAWVQLCLNQPVVGSSCDGAYAEMMIARMTGLVSIPDELSSEEAAPLRAGIATFNALKKSGAEAGARDRRAGTSRAAIREEDGFQGRGRRLGAHL